MVEHNKIDSKFFKFNPLEFSNKLNISIFKGWNQSIILKFNLKKKKFY